MWLPANDIFAEIRDKNFDDVARHWLGTLIIVCHRSINVRRVRQTWWLMILVTDNQVCKYLDAAFICPSDSVGLCPKGENRADNSIYLML